MSEYLSREALLTKSPRRYRDVELPVRGGKVRIQSLTEKERSRFERENMAKDGKVSGSKLETIRRRLMVICIVDASGNLLLTPDDVGILAEWDSADVDAIQTAITEHCGFTEEDLESIAKNSERMTVAASPSA